MATEHELADLLEMLENTREDRSRMRFTRAWLSDHQLTCEQAVKILKQLFGLGDVRLQTAKEIYPKLVDPENFINVVLPNGFEYDDERAEVRQALGI